MGLLGTIGLITAIGTAVEVIGRVKAGNAAKRLGQYNAAIAEGQAIDATRRGEEDVSEFRQGIRGLEGTQRAGYAGQNVDVMVGTPIELRHQTEHRAQADMERIRRNAEREAQGYRVEAENARRGGQMAQQAGRWGAASTVIGGSSNLLLMRYGWQQQQDAKRTPRRG